MGLVYGSSKKFEIQVAKCKIECKADEAIGNFGCHTKGVERQVGSGESRGTQGYHWAPQWTL